ncbi:hypothetical protein Tco_1504413 [Tanacetum coccineum]
MHSIRSDLLFEMLMDRLLPNQAKFDAIKQLMGYEGDLTVLTFNKALFSPQWRFLFHTINHCLSSKSTSWDQIPTNIATAVICLTSNQKYNFSKLIFDGMLRHLDAKKKFVMYPRFISIFLGKQLVNVPVPLDHFPVNTLTSKVFSFMVKKGKHFSGKVTPLFATMLVQPTKDEGAPSERPSEAQPTPSPAPTSEVPNEPQTDSSPAQTSEVPIEQQTDLSPRPSPTTIIPDSIPETSGGNLGGHSSSDKSLSGNEGEMTLQSVYDLCLSLCAQVSDQAKEIQHLKALQRLAIKNLQKTKGAQRSLLSKLKMKFAKGESSVQRDPLFDEIPEDTVDHMETENAQDEGRTRDIVDEDKEIEENVLSTEDARIEAERLLLRKLQGPRKDQRPSGTEPPTKNQLRNQMMTYLKHVGNFKHAELKIKKFEEVQVLYKKIKRSDEDFISIGSAEDERLIKRMNEKGVDSSKSEVIKRKKKSQGKEDTFKTLLKMKGDKERYQDEIPEGFDRSNFGGRSDVMLESEEYEHYAVRVELDCIKKVASIVRTIRIRLKGIEEGWSVVKPPHNKWTTIHHAYRPKNWASPKQTACG